MSPSFFFFAETIFLRFATLILLVPFFFFPLVQVLMNPTGRFWSVSPFSFLVPWPPLPLLSEDFWSPFLVVEDKFFFLRPCFLRSLTFFFLRLCAHNFKPRPLSSSHLVFVQRLDPSRLHISWFLLCCFLPSFPVSYSTPFPPFSDGSVGAETFFTFCGFEDRKSFCSASFLLETFFPPFFGPVLMHGDFSRETLGRPTAAPFFAQLLFCFPLDHINCPNLPPPNTYDFFVLGRSLSTVTALFLPCLFPSDYLFGSRLFR